MLQTCTTRLTTKATLEASFYVISFLSRNHVGFRLLASFLFVPLLAVFTASLCPQSISLSLVILFLSIAKEAVSLFSKGKTPLSREEVQ